MAQTQITPQANQRGQGDTFDPLNPDGPGFARAEMRPAVPTEIQRYVGYWWGTSSQTPEFRDYRRQVVADEHDLFPFDERRARRNEQSGDRAGMRSKADARIVQNAHLYRASQRAVAMTIPDGHGFNWKQVERILDQKRQESPSKASQNIDQFALTMTKVEQMHLEEIGFQSIGEDWVRDACHFRAGILKAWYAIDYLTDPISVNRLPDMQDELAEMDSLMQDFALGRFDQKDGRYTRMINMQIALAEKTQLKVWQGIEAETVRLDTFRIDPRIKSVDSFYSAKWMCEDMIMAKRDILARFPYRLDPDNPENPKGFMGVHPDDLVNGSYSDSSSGELLDQERQRRELDRDRRPNRLNTENQAYDNIGDDDLLIMVRQLYIRDEGKVLVLVDGLEYPAWEWRPQHTPAHWYPFYPIVLNRQSNTWLGRSDTEIASDEQARINQKMTDDEKLRELAKARGIYNRQNMDPEEAAKINEIQAGQFRGISIPSGTIAENFQWFMSPYDPRLTDITVDVQMLDKMVGMPEALLGQMGSANFATELDLAAQGTNIMTSARQAIVRRALSFFYTSMAEILLQVLDEEQVKLMAGPDAYWPKLYGEAEAKRLKEALTIASVEETSGILLQIENSDDPITAATQFPGIENPAKFAQDLYNQLAMEEWDQLEPLTRESMFKRLQIEVDTTTNADFERRIQSDRIATYAQAMTAQGVKLSSKAWGNILAQALGIKEDADDLIQVDGNISVADLLQAVVNDGIGSLEEPSLRMLANLGALSQTALVQMAEAAGVEMANEAASSVVNANAQITAEEEEAAAAEEADEMPGAPQPPAEGGMEAAEAGGPFAR